LKNLAEQIDGEIEGAYKQYLIAYLKGPTHLDNPSSLANSHLIAYALGMLDRGQLTLRTKGGLREVLLQYLM
jgi:hypothetical protein